MKRNVGRLDQILRVGISLVLIYIGFIDKEFITDPLSSSIIGIVGVLSLVVALLRFCPLYVVTGISTCNRKNQ